MRRTPPEGRPRIERDERLDYWTQTVREQIVPV
jgi:hypothetical protein